MYSISIKAHTRSYYSQLIPSESMQDFIDYYHVSTRKRQLFISSINRKIDDSRWFLFVAESTNKIVGYTLAYVENNNTLTLKGLFVDPKYHHQGIGSHLFEAKLNSAGKGMRIQLSVITSNKVAKAVYEKYGFKLTGPDSKTFFGAKQDIMERESGTY
ncbi:GNAT family N-acetyltransferase [Candidatus Saccharibacteria bacterium]|nr:GNAT family N-acetyltransferase [Candidatus Saccharibacteria bacterium]